MRSLIVVAGLALSVGAVLGYGAHWSQVPHCFETVSGHYCPPKEADSASMHFIGWRGERAFIDATQTAKNGWYGTRFSNVDFYFKNETGQWETSHIYGWISGGQMDAHGRLLTQKLDQKHDSLYVDPKEEELEYEAETACREMYRAKRKWG